MPALTGNIYRDHQALAGLSEDAQETLIKAARLAKLYGFELTPENPVEVPANGGSDDLPDQPNTKSITFTDPCGPYIQLLATAYDSFWRGAINFGNGIINRYLTECRSRAERIGHTLNYECPGLVYIRSQEIIKASLSGDYPIPEKLERIFCLSTPSRAEMITFHNMFPLRWLADLLDYDEMIFEKLQEQSPSSSDI